MPWLEAPDYWLTRWFLERAIAAIYVVAFLVAVNQFPALLGENGLLPAPRFLAVASFREVPSIFHWRYSDGLLRITGWTGILIAAALIVGLPQAGPVWLPMLAWLLLWVLYLSIVNIGQTFYSFGWESLLLEAGFLAIFLGSATIAPPISTIWLLRWLLFRVEFGAGLIKIRHDPCWRDLTCLYYHHETQPMPNPLSWYFHRAPKPIHRLEVLGNHFGQLIVPFALFAPQPFAGAAGLIMVVHQVWLVLSGNFAWLNWVTIAIAIAAFDDGQLQRLLPVTHATLEPWPGWYTAVVLAATVVLLVLSYWPARNLLSRGQLMNFTYNPFHLVNSYGAFGNITRERREVAVEGTLDAEITAATTWQEYEFKGKPGDPRRCPPQVAPYHLRLDWLMWFAAMSPAFGEPWFLPFLIRLLENDGPTLRLLKRNPFTESPPAFVRASIYRYRFSTWRERNTSGAWWVRERVGVYLSPIRLDSRRAVGVSG
jgi:Lipase maturation factor